ncbi:MAG: hypothetical protein OXI81_21780 [Paracoccaceae bacterium]|nr:hypothetical protein [Paracoccaceae bacterium]
MQVPVLSPEDWQRLFAREPARAEAGAARIVAPEDDLGEAEARAEARELGRSGPTVNSTDFGGFLRAARTRFPPRVRS